MTMITNSSSVPYSVGVKVMDQQHKRLVALVNELFEAMQRGSGNQGAAKVLRGLLDYTRTHFRTGIL
jgi:Hemerythrin